jgi:hypothetical protein
MGQVSPMAVDHDIGECGADPGVKQVLRLDDVDEHYIDH